jgi:hypothetical protein
MDFFQIKTKEARGGTLVVYPDFVVSRSKDFMVRGKSFYAIWDEEKGLWSTDEYDVQRIVDAELKKYADEHGIENVNYMRSFSTNGWNQFRKFMNQISDNSHQLDDKLVFKNTPVKKSDYISRRLPYDLAEGDHSAWDELLDTLYTPEERAKIEWAIGSVVAGASKKIEKFLVFYGPGGTGKSTILKIIQKLFEGYVVMFDAKALVGNNNSFSTAVFKDHPLVAIQHDGDLSRIDDNSKINSIISHEDMTINEKYKPGYTSSIVAFLFMGTNKPVKITDAKSGIIRRLIDVHPTGELFTPEKYHILMDRIAFEYGAIAQHCLEVFKAMGKNFYNGYQPVEMMLQTDVFFNFVEAHFETFSENDGTTLRKAFELYKEFCNYAGIDKPLPQYKFREELRNYFHEFKDRHAMPDGTSARSYYLGFKAKSYKAPVDDDVQKFSLVLKETESLLDDVLADQPAQGFKIGPDGSEIPDQKWSYVHTTLGEIDTSGLHYVKVPKDHIVIDFDLTDDKGNKSLEKNLEAASHWPATYAELSKGGSGVHLHYIFDGDVEELANKYSEGIEIKTLLGDASLRRRLTKCNDVPVATISSGLPFKEKKMLDEKVLKSEKGLRDLIARNMRKEIHPGTKPSIDFIKKILDDAYASGMDYDVSDLKGRLIIFANNSSNQRETCIKTVLSMRYKSQGELAPAVRRSTPTPNSDEAPLAFFDVEVYPNLFVVVWKFDGGDKVPMINPTPEMIEGLFKLRLVGFNNRKYDNHILWARMMGYNNEQLYNLSQKIINNVPNSTFSAAYELSYTDIYDYASVKQSLKKWQFALGIKHKELDLPWDQPVPDDRIQDVVDYCGNDVDSTEATHHARKGDFQARQILAELSGLTVNHTTQKHTAAIIFNGDRNPQADFVYTNLSKEFPGYVYDFGKSTYHGEVVGEGGYVYAEPGIYEDVVLLDVASMHPTSIRELNLFGPYTPKFTALMDARLAIKHHDLDTAKQMLDGKLAPYLENEEDVQALSDALKIVINIVYGLTSAKFDNPFRDIRNKDNIVAKRGALFMIELKHFIQEAGFQVVHIKTDSVKIPGAPSWLIEDIQKFGEKYGYTFEHEATFEKFCLVNDAVYIAKYGWAQKAKKIGKWEAVGAQFQHPYVFKKLFDPGANLTEKDITFDDLRETKQVSKGSMWLDFDSVKPMHMVDGEAKMHFVGRTGQFVPVREGFGGGILYRVHEGKNYAVSGTKGYIWAEAFMVEEFGIDCIDMDYFDKIADSARKAIEKFGNFEEFVS